MQWTHSYGAVGMRWSGYLEGATIGACAIVTSACELNLPCLTCPTGGPFQVSGEVLDDSLDLPPDSRARITLEGARVEVLDGTDTGKFALTDSSGRFDLGTVQAATGSGGEVLTRLRASKDGWLSKEWKILDSFSAKHVFHLSQPPHVVWGCVSLGLSGGQPIPHAGVRVQIVDGPDAGRVAFTDGTGYYRFDDLATQPQFSLELSKAGYQTTRNPSYGQLAGNQGVNTGVCSELRPE
jgi:hypothetical protein